MHATLTVLALACLPGVAFAQQQTDQEYQNQQLDSKGSKTTTKLGFETEVHTYDNLDFRPLDESSDQAILDSDDRGQFAFTGVNIALAYQPSPDMTLNIAASHRGLWGNDQTGSVNRFGGFMYVTGLSFDWKPGAKSKDDNGVMVRIGRQYYELGGIGGSPDFVLSDVLDGIYYKPEGAEYSIYYASTYLYLTPDIFTGILSGLFFLFVVLTGVSCLGAIQGPSSFTHKEGIPAIGREN